MTHFLTDRVSYYDGITQKTRFRPKKCRIRILTIWVYNLILNSESVHECSWIIKIKFWIIIRFPTSLVIIRLWVKYTGDGHLVTISKYVPIAVRSVRGSLPRLTQLKWWQQFVTEIKRLSIIDQLTLRRRRLRLNDLHVGEGLTNHYLKQGWKNRVEVFQNTCSTFSPRHFCDRPCPDRYVRKAPFLFAYYQQCCLKSHAGYKSWCLNL